MQSLIPEAAISDWTYFSVTSSDHHDEHTQELHYIVSGMEATKNHNGHAGSIIYQFNETLGQFEEFQRLDSLEFVYDVEVMQFDDRTFLAFAQGRMAERVTSISSSPGVGFSRVFQRCDVSGKFYLFQKLPASTASDFKFFSMNGKHMLAVTNRYGDVLPAVPSSQQYPLNDNTLVTIAGLTRARIPRLVAYVFDDGVTNEFIEYQRFNCEHPTDIDHSFINGKDFLFVANGNVAAPSSIFTLNAKTNFFELFQEIQSTTSASDVEAFSIGTRQYLAVANHMDGTGTKKTHTAGSDVWKPSNFIYEMNPQTEKYIPVQRWPEKRAFVFVILN